MAILGAIFNISKCSMMPEWHQLDSSNTMSEQEESAKKKTLKSSSRLFWFSTGLFACNVEMTLPCHISANLGFLESFLHVFF